MIKNIVGFYNSMAEIGNHESHYEKIGKDFSKDISYFVTYVVDNSDATVECEGSISKLSAGTILGLNALIKTNDSKVEISTSTGKVFRLGVRSEFCLENTIEGLAPVYYGEVYLSSWYDRTIFSGGKYRTSCWIGDVTNVLIERVNNSSDYYYALDRPVDIYEYDELGRKFQIIHVEPFHKCKLSFDFSKQIRERYNVESITHMDFEEIESIYSEYVVPTGWMDVSNFKNAQQKVEIAG